MSGSSGEMGNLLKQAQKMQRAMDEAREELRETTVEGIAGGGNVRVTVTGDGRVDNVELTEEIARTGDRKLLEELLKTALDEGIQKATRLREERMAKVTGGLQLPGLM